MFFGRHIEYTFTRPSLFLIEVETRVGVTQWTFLPMSVMSQLSPPQGFLSLQRAIGRLEVGKRARAGGDSIISQNPFSVVYDYIFTIVQATGEAEVL